MKNKKLRVENLILKYKKVLNLSHWKVTFRIREDSSEGAAAEINVQGDYMSAVITVYECAFDKDNDLEHIIKHELCHIITEPLVLFCYDLLNARFRTPTEFEQQREIMTERIARLI